MSEACVLCNQGRFCFGWHCEGQSSGGGGVIVSDSQPANDGNREGVLWVNLGAAESIDVAINQRECTLLLRK